jgi:putative membrane protein
MMSAIHGAAIGAQPYDRWDHMDGWGWMWVGGLVWLIVLAGLIGLVTWLVIRGTGPSSRSPHTDAKRILAERFARGEIDEDEFRRRSDLLG